MMRSHRHYGFPARGSPARASLLLGPEFLEDPAHQIRVHAEPEELLVKTPKGVVERFCLGRPLQGERVLGRNDAAARHRRKDRNILQQVYPIQVGEGAQMVSGCPPTASGQGEGNTSKRELVGLFLPANVDLVVHQLNPPPR